MLNASELRDVKLFVGDDQRYTLPIWPDQMIRGAKNVMDFVDGFAVHFYVDRFVPPFLLDLTHKKYPNKILLNTESSFGSIPGDGGRWPILGSWERAQKFALGIIQDLQHHVSGWIDWGLVLDETGGPSYVNNSIDSPIIFNTTSKNEYYKEPIFYVMGHFSKFILPGSVRIDAKLSGFLSGKVKVVAFLRPDDVVAIVFYNQYNKQKIVEFTDEVRGSHKIELEPQSITTFLYA